MRSIDLLLNHPPPGVRCEQSGNQIRLSWRWFNLLAPLHFAFSIFYLTMIVWGLSSQPPTQFSSIVTVALLLIVGLGFAYWSASALVNRSSVIVDHGTIASRNGPLPSHLGSRAIDVTEVYKVYLHQRSTFERRPPFGFPYQLRIQTSNDEHIKLAGGIQGIDRALFLQSVLERSVTVRDH